MRDVPADAVDAIVAQWSRERSDLDFAPLAVFSRLSRINKHLDALRKGAFAEAGLDLAEFDVLSALRRAGAPYALSPKQLLETNLVSSGTMTNRIDRLVRRGLVERQADPNDRRSVRVQLTSEGKTRADTAIQTLVQIEQDALSALPETARDELIASLRILSLRLTKPQHDPSGPAVAERAHPVTEQRNPTTDTSEQTN